MIRVSADAIARFKRLDGYDVFAMTGTDEHGQKVQRTAAQNGLSPKDFVDGIATRFQEMEQRLGCSFDRFIRTTDADHLPSTQELWRRMEANGDIYLFSDGNYLANGTVFCFKQNGDLRFMLEAGMLPKKTIFLK